MTSTSYYDISDDSYEDFTPNRSSVVNHGDIQMVNSQINDVKSMVCDIMKVNQALSLPLGVVRVLEMCSWAKYVMQCI